MEVAFGAEVGDCEAEDGEAVEFRQNVLLEGKEGGQRVELTVQTLSMPFRRIALRHSVLRRGFYAEKKIKKYYMY